MEILANILGWLWWGIVKVLGLAWSFAWFLLGGWVATLAQIAVIALVIFGYKYGWKQAPQELLARAGPAGRYLWSWVRTREPGAMVPRTEMRERAGAPRGRLREAGDVNLSTLLSVVALAGLALAVAV